MHVHVVLGAKPVKSNSKKIKMYENIEWVLQQHFGYKNVELHYYPESHIYITIRHNLGGLASYRYNINHVNYGIIDIILKDFVIK